MPLIVQKFGGTSLQDADRIHRAAQRAIDAKLAGSQVVMVVSAMGHTTDHLVDLAGQVCASFSPPKREMDVLLSTGEQVSIALMAMAIQARGHKAISLTGPQVGLVTDQTHTKARIERIDGRPVRKHLAEDAIVIVAGFQGINALGDITTLGRGGSDTTAVALAAALQADACEVFTDVRGMYTADPRLVKTARKLDAISYDECLELSSLGAQVMHSRSIEFGKKYGIVIHVRHSQLPDRGTLITQETPDMEQIAVRGCALKRGLARVTLRSLPDQPGVAAKLFADVALAKIVVDDIVQTEQPGQTANISFTIDEGELRDVEPVVDRFISRIGGGSGTYDHGLAKVSAVGVGMRTHTGVAQKMFGALADAKINIQNITTSEIKISCIIADADGEQALRVVHDAFDLGRPEVEIVNSD